MKEKKISSRQQQDKGLEKLNELKTLIDELANRIKTESLEQISLKELIVPPEGYAYKIIKLFKELENAKLPSKENFVKLTRVQLRKIFSEFRNIYENFKKQENIKVKTTIYKLYPLLKYQENRKLLYWKLNELFFEILEDLDKALNTKKDESLKNVFDRAYEFIQALVAYIPKES